MNAVMSAITKPLASKTVPTVSTRLFSFFLTLVGVFLFFSGRVAAQETICARVRIEIKQKLTLERQTLMPR